jgi:flagellum-specific ATP synthase
MASVSRVMMGITDQEHYKIAQKFRSVLAAYLQSEDLINIGAYVSGSNPAIDKAVELIGPINNFLRQEIYEHNTFNETIAKLKSLLS